MSSAANPLCPVTLYTPPPGDNHVAHPMVQLPSSESQPFTLTINPTTNTYQMSFQNQVTSAQDPNGWGVRIYIAAFQTTVSDPFWIDSVALAASGSDMEKTVTLLVAGQNTTTNIWVGAWWNNGAYGADKDGNDRYFAAHPYGGMHHTVPILVG